MRSADEMRAWSRAAVEAWNAKDLDAFYSTFHDDVVYHGGPTAELRGLAALRERFSMALQICPDLTITTHVLVIGEDCRSVASVQTESGTMVDGKPFGFRGMTLLQVNEAGLVTEMWEITEPLS